MRNGHLVLRVLLAAHALGAAYFRSDNTIPHYNPLFLRNDTNDTSLRFGSGYRHGIILFLRMVEAGVIPTAPTPGQIKGVAPVAIAVPDPSPRFQRQSIFHDFDKYTPQHKEFAVNSLECWSAYSNVPDYDITAIAHGSTRRWDSLFPHSPAGFVPLVPFSTRQSLESTFSWCNRSFATDTDAWAEFSDLATARNNISAEILRQRDANSLIRVLPTNTSQSSTGDGEGACFWQLIEAPILGGGRSGSVSAGVPVGSATSSGVSTALFMLLMDPGALSPALRRVTLRLGRSAHYGGYDVYDQLGEPKAPPLGTLVAAASSVDIVVPAGAARFLVLLNKT